MALRLWDYGGPIGYNQVKYNGWALPKHQIPPVARMAFVQGGGYQHCHGGGRSGGGVFGGVLNLLFGGGNFGGGNFGGYC